MNWYDTRTLEAKPPLFSSSVDSGNLVASLWTLQQGCLDQLQRPVLSRALVEGLLDHLRVLVHLRALSPRTLARCEVDFQGETWLAAILNFSEDVLEARDSDIKPEALPDVTWFREQVRVRVQKVHDLVGSYMPCGQRLS